jgi:ABC-type phosphate transport system substrate-binding protein
MIAKIHDTPYSIGYVGVSFHEDVAKAGIGTAALKSYDGEFLLPTPQAIEAAAAALWPRTPADERLTLVNAPGANAYPLINYEYAVVSKKQPSPRPRPHCAVFYCGRSPPTRQTRSTSPTRILSLCQPTSGCSATTRSKT